MKTLSRFLPITLNTRWQRGPRKLLLLLSQEGVYAQYWCGKQMICASFFGNSSQQLASFARFLRQYPYCCSLLLDINDEEFHYENIPSLNSRQRRQLLNRKQRQLYPQTPYHCYQLDSKQHKVVWSAITRPYLLQPWLDVLQQCQLPLAGIYSIPLLTRQQSTLQEQVLFVSWQSNSGLRLSFCQHQQLRITRLLSPSAEQSWTTMLLQELPRTQSYLRSIGLISTGQILHIHIICQANEHAWLQAQLPPSANVEYQWHIIPQHDACHFWLQQLAEQPPKLNYSPPHLKREYYFWWLLQQANWFALILLLSCITWIWSQQNDFEQQRLQQYQLQQQIQKLNQAQLRLQQTQTHTSVSPSDIHSSVTVLQQWQAHNPQASQLLPPLSKVIEQFPQVELQQLSWESKLPDTGEPAMTRIRFEAFLINFKQDFREAHQYQQAFEQALRQAGYRTQLLESAIKLDPKLALNSPNSTDKLKFVMELETW